MDTGMATTLDEKPKPGDLIEIFCGPYQHWAVYIGDGFVVHLAPLSEAPGAGVNSVKSVLAEKAMVKKEKLRDVVGTNEWKINNNKDNEYEPRPAQVIVKEACELVGKELPYCVLTKNCEHFVNELRYGKAESRQVRNAAMAAGAVGVAGALIAGIAVWANSGNKEEKQERKDKQ